MASLAKVTHVQVKIQAYLSSEVSVGIGTLYFRVHVNTDFKSLISLDWDIILLDK